MVNDGEPRNLRETFDFSDARKWELAMQEEYKSLIANATWELAPLPTGHKAVKCKWVFCTKKNANSVVVWLKVRLVAKGACK